MKETALKEKKQQQNRDKSYWAQFCSRNRGNLIVGGILSIASAGTSIALAFLLQQLIDVATGGTVKDLLRVFLFGGCLLVSILLVEFTKRFFVHRFYYRGLVSYKNFVFGRMLSNDVYAFRQNQTGKYISGLNNDINAIETGYLENIFSVITYVAMFIGGLVAMAWFNLVMFGCVIVSSLLPILVSILLSGGVAREEKKVSEENDRYVSDLRDMLAGFSVIKSFQVENEMQQIFDRKNCKLESAKRRKRNVISNVTILSSLAANLLLTIVFGMGAYLAIAGEITVGVVVGCIQLLNYISGPIQLLPTAFSRIKAARALVDKMQNEVENSRDHSEAVHMEAFRHDICFEKLSFSYESEKMVLHDLSLKFEKGKSYAIVGASGSGKSTILNLLLGHHRDYTGSLTLDGIEIRDISTASLYQMISVIQQNVFIFDDDIYANITMHREFSQERVEEAVRRSGLQSLIDEKGADYSCGEGGSRLSGGERQRISIARTLLRGTEILLMDEATAALDNLTAAMVEQAILELDGLTRIIVTHKLSEQSLRQYDSIIVVRNGTVMEQGTCSELMEKGGYLSALLSISGGSDEE